MKRITLFIAIALFFSFTQKNSFTNLLQLEGSWQMKNNKDVIGEIWTKNNNHQLTSKAYFLKKIDTVFYENVVLENTTKGIFYTVTAVNQNNEQPVSFKLTSSINNKFVFENPKHDFPRRIVYEFVNTDSIHAFIDDGKESTKKRQHFHFSRIK